MPNIDNLPQWGVFIIAILFLVFRFISDITEKISRKKRVSKPPIEREITGEHLIGALHERHERTEMLGTMKKALAVAEDSHKAWQRAESHHVATLERLVKAQDRQTVLLTRLVGLFDEHRKEIRSLGRDVDHLMRGPSTKTTVQIPKIVER